MRFRTALTDLLGIEHPVVLAPMAEIAGGALAAAVSKAGGLGLIAGAYADAPWLEKEFACAGDAAVGVGFVSWSLANRPAVFDAVLEKKPKAVMLSYGDPFPFLAQAKQAGVPVLMQVQTLNAARVAADAGADIIVMQGTEAGGHAGTRTTLGLVPAAIDLVAPRPVLAAGGIADGRGLAAVLAMGAAGAVIGTRFYTAEESLAHPAAKDRVTKSSGDDTVRTRIFDQLTDLDWPAPYLARVLRNGTTASWHGRETQLAQAIGPERERYIKALNSGDYSRAAIPASEAVDLVRDMAPAAVILQRLIDEAAAAHARIAPVV
jgi:nitronate monooxygenase